MDPTWTIAAAAWGLIVSHGLCFLMGIFTGLAWRVYRRPPEPEHPEWPRQSG